MMNPIISPETCEFRDECVEYFHKDHTKLLSEYITQVCYIKKLDQMNKEGKLLIFLTFEDNNVNQFWNSIMLARISRRIHYQHEF